MNRISIKIKEHRLMKHFRKERLKPDQVKQKKGGLHGQ